MDSLVKSCLQADELWARNFLASSLWLKDLEGYASFWISSLVVLSLRQLTNLEKVRAWCTAGTALQLMLGVQSVPGRQLWVRPLQVSTNSVLVNKNSSPNEKSDRAKCQLPVSNVYILIQFDDTLSLR